LYQIWHGIRNADDADFLVILIGEWRIELKCNPTTVKLVVGGEPGFSGLDVIHRCFKKALKMEFPIYDTLADTVAAAVCKTRQPQPAP